MNPYDPLHGSVLETRQIYGFDAATNLAVREFGRVDRMMREMDRMNHLAQETGRINRIAREIEPFHAARERNEAAFSQHLQSLQLQEKLAQSLRPVIAEEVLLRPANLYNYTSALAQSQAILSQFTVQAVAQHYAAFDVSRIVAEINKQTSVSQAMNTFAERVMRDANLRDGLVSGLASAYAAIPASIRPPSTVKYDELFRTVIQGFDEVGLTRSGFSYQAILWRFEAWLESHPPNVRKILIGIIIAVATIAFQEALNFCKEELKAQPKLHENHISPEPRAEIGSDMCR